MNRKISSEMSKAFLYNEAYTEKKKTVFLAHFPFN